MKIILTGGGTGGHIYPVLSIGKKLLSEGWDVLYIGSKGGLEEKIIPAEDLNYISLEQTILPRKINFKLIYSLYKNFKGFIQSYKLLKDFKPDVAVGAGGFVSGPVILAATMLGIPSIIHEQNVYPGFTNRLLSYRANKIALNFPEAEKYFPVRTRKKILVSGNPIREVIINTQRKDAIQKLKLDPDKKTILVFGGSQGSTSLNNSMLAIYQYFKNRPFLQIIHITGEKNYDKIIKKLSITGINQRDYDNFIIKAYLHNIEFAYAAADLVISRAGATGLAEITARGIPSILVPYPYAAGDHQRFNARVMEENKAAIVIEDDKLNGDILKRIILDLLNDEITMKKMSEKSKGLARPEALNILVQEVKNLLKK
jgi:UDP-N-acetylglucosamine--N-acetylmuramyl-(pentapeptide) pyrophosphoryl-undecaprenol N-acetylglucosamine transferase